MTPICRLPVRMKVGTMWLLQADRYWCVIVTLRNSYHHLVSMLIRNLPRHPSCSELGLRLRKVSSCYNCFRLLGMHLFVNELHLQNQPVSLDLFSPVALPSLSDTRRHATKFRRTKRGYETINGHKYVLHINPSPIRMQAYENKT